MQIELCCQSMHEKKKRENGYKQMSFMVARCTLTGYLLSVLCCSVAFSPVVFQSLPNRRKKNINLSLWRHLWRPESEVIFQILFSHEQRWWIRSTAVLRCRSNLLGARLQLDFLTLCVFSEESQVSSDWLNFVNSIFIYMEIKEGALSGCAAIV